jgi:hypothetical protein
MLRHLCSTVPGVLMTTARSIKTRSGLRSRSFSSLLITILLSSSLLPASAVSADSARENTIAASGAQEKPFKLIGGKLVGSVRHDESPFIDDGKTTETIPEGTPLKLTVTTSLNSELAKEGDEIRAAVTTDVRDKEGKKIVLPGKWQVVGHVTRVEGQKRAGRDGFIDIKFDKLVSPDGKWEVPLDASASTKSSPLKTVAKQVKETTGYTAVGAIGGSILSVQLTGIPVAINTYGISVGIGAAAGAAAGIVAALHRKGDILCAYPGDEINIRLPGTLVLPAFKQETVPSKAPIPQLEDVNIMVRDHKFMPFPYGDKNSRLLAVTFIVENNSKSEFCFGDLGVVCNHNHSYLPYAADNENLKLQRKKIKPGGVQEGTIVFQVGNPRLKYSLVLVNKATSHILSQVAIN